MARKKIKDHYTLVAISSYQSPQTEIDKKILRAKQELAWYNRKEAKELASKIKHPFIKMFGVLTQIAKSEVSAYRDHGVNIYWQQFLLSIYI